MSTMRKMTLLTNERSHTLIGNQHLLRPPVADIDDDRLVLTLNLNGMISDCNKAGSRLLGCMPSDLIWQPISNLLPQLKNIALMKGSDINPYLRFLSRVGYHFDVISRKGVHWVGRAFFCEVGGMEQHFLRVIICPVGKPNLI